MFGGKKNIVYRKKRKGKFFIGVQRYGKKVKEMLCVDIEIVDCVESFLCDLMLLDVECD